MSKSLKSLSTAILLLAVAALPACETPPPQTDIPPQTASKPSENPKKTTPTPSNPLNEEAAPEQVSDTIRSIIDELQLCDEFTSYDRCYEKRSAKFIPLLPKGDYTCFLFDTYGGSGGDNMKVYEKRNGHYRMVNDFFSFYDTLPSTLTNGHYDIILAGKDYDRGMVRRLMKWNGHKYIQSKLLTVNGHPIDILVAAGIIDPRKLATKFPYIGETKDYFPGIYSMIGIDTLCTDSNYMELIVATSADSHYGSNCPCKLIFEKGKYRKVKING